MPVPTVTITGTVVTPGNTALEGKRVTFRLLQPLRDGDDNVLVAARRWAATLDATGALADDNGDPFALIPDDLTGTAVGYEVTEQWRGGETYTTSISVADAPSIDYLDLPRAVTPAAPVSFLATAQALADETSSRESADTALDVRLDALEADPTTQTALDQEATARSDADTALAADLADETARAEGVEASLIPLTQKGAVGGVATLDGAGTVPDAQIPSTIARDAETATAVANAVAALVNSAPGTLDTLGEIATALQADESAAAALTTKVAGKVDYVIHGSTAGTARPAGATVVLWVGSVNPTNAVVNDFLWNTSSKLLFRYTGTVWDQHGSATYGALAGPNEWQGAQQFDGQLTLGKTDGNSANFWLQSLSQGWAASPKWEFGIDASNHGGGIDYYFARTSWRIVTDAVLTNASTVLDSATAQFGPVDNGVQTSGTGIPNGTTLTPVGTTVDVASNGAALPQATITVASTAGFPTSGTILVDTTTRGPQTITYTGVTGTTFTGCSGGGGTLATGGTVTSMTRATLSQAATASAAGVQVTVGQAQAVGDLIFINWNPGWAPTVGIGVTPPTLSHRLSVSAPDALPNMGTLKLRVSTGQLGDVLTVVQSNGTTRNLYIGNTGYISGENGQGLVVRADTANSRTYVMAKADGTTTYGWFYSGNNVRFRYITGGVDHLEIGGGAFRHLSSNLAFYGATAAAKQSVTGALSTVTDANAKAVLTSILSALSTVGLVTNSTT